MTKTQEGTRKRNRIRKRDKAEEAPRKADRLTSLMAEEPPEKEAEKAKVAEFRPEARKVEAEAKVEALRVVTRKQNCHARGVVLATTNKSLIIRSHSTAPNSKMDRCLTTTFASSSRIRTFATDVLAKATIWTTAKPPSSVAKFLGAKKSTVFGCILRMEPTRKNRTPRQVRLWPQVEQGQSRPT